MVEAVFASRGHHVGEGWIDEELEALTVVFKASTAYEHQRVSSDVLFVPTSAYFLAARDISDPHAGFVKHGMKPEHEATLLRTNVQDRDRPASDVLPMASIRKHIEIDAAPQVVWDALSDWGALHVRLVPGFAIDTVLDGDDRIVTFATGLVLRERLIDCDHAARRLVWSIVDGPYAHHNGAAEVLDAPNGTTRFVWIADVLPHGLAEPTGASMQLGIETIRRTFEAA
jgi:hypothetical protein